MRAVRQGVFFTCMETRSMKVVSMQHIQRFLSFSAILLLSYTATFAALAAEDDAAPTPVTPFELDRYVGQWYELARIDNRFERGMTHVTATYSKRDDGRMGVINKGWKTKDERWKSSDAVGWFAGEEDVGSLRVRFFWPFSAEYIVADKCPDYQWAIVVSKDLAWILHRDATISEELRADLIERARKAGVAVDDLLWVEQENRPADPESEA